MVLENRIPALLPVLVLGFLCACSSPSIDVSEAGGEFAELGLHPVRSSGFEEVYARENAGLPGYRAVNIEPLKLDRTKITTAGGSGTLGRDWEMTPQRQTRLRSDWAAAMGQAFSDYEQAAGGDSVLRITSELTDVMQGSKSTTATTAGGLPVAGSRESADIRVEVRLYDRASGDLLAVIRDRRTIPAAQWSRAEGMGMINLFRSWAGLLHSRIAGR